MKLLLLVLLGWAYNLQAQDSPTTFITKNELVQQDFYEEHLGTKGILLSFEYLYTNSAERLSLQYPVVALHQEGTNVYSEQQMVLPLQANSWAKAQIFIPYRKINLFKGTQEGVLLSVKINDWWTYTKTITYQQPRRYKVDIQVRNGAVKEKLTPYDEGVPMKEWLPDPYFILTTNGGISPLFKSKVAFNQYEIPLPAISIYVLEGEQLQWSFYDRDGAEDQLLGIYNDFKQEGTIYEDYFGVMFGAIKNLEFTYSRKVQAPQAINVYSDPNYEYKGRKGVALTVKYDLPEAFVGQEAQAIFEFYDKNGIRLNVPVLYPLEKTEAIDQKVRLKRRGQLQYFVPFYVWKEACRAVEFSFERADGERIRAARHFLRQSIQFEDWVISADLKVIEDVSFQGAKGVELHAKYAIKEVYDNAPLYLRFYRADGTALPFSLYYLEGKNKGRIIQKEHKIEKPRLADELVYFIPYSVLNDEVIAVRAELVPDIAMMIFEKFTPLLSNKGKAKDVNLKIVKAEERFRSGSYGQVIELKVDVPAFYREESQLYLEVSENGKASKKILVEGASQELSKTFSITNDSGRVYLILPHRNVRSGSTFKIKAYLLDVQQKRPMSDVVEWNWTAPQDLLNTEIEVELTTCKFDKKILKDVSLSQDFPWKYRVQVGQDLLVDEPMSQRFVKNSGLFTQTINVNREDKIVVQLFNVKTKRNVILWKGDLSKWEQSGFKTNVENKYPIKTARITAKVPDNYNRSRSTENTESNTSNF